MSSMSRVWVAPYFSVFLTYRVTSFLTSCPLTIWRDCFELAVLLNLFDAVPPFSVYMTDKSTLFLSADLGDRTLICFSPALYFTRSLL